MTNALTVTAVPDSTVIEASREFDAPLSALWRAYTEPELLARWLGPRQYAIEEVELDARSGGHYRYVHRGPDGQTFGFHGVIHSVVSHESITQTFEFEGMPGHVSLERVSFSELSADRTGIAVHSVFQSVEDRDGMIASGMEGGMADSYDRLAELLPTL